MYKNVRVENETNEVQKYFLILYQGVKRKHFYWEFVNSARKIAILITFLLPESLQILFSLSVLVSTWRLQSYLQPYKNNDNNEIEILGVNVAMITLCCGMIYNSPDTNNTLNFFLLLLLLILNIIFITKWLYLIILSLAEKSEFFKAISDLITKFILFKKVKKPTSVNDKKADVIKKRLKFKRRPKKKGRKHRRKKFDDKKTFREIGDLYIVKSTTRRGQLTGSEQRMINEFGEIHHSNKDNQERSSDEIESKILDRNPESDSSRLDMILHALKNSNKSNEYKKNNKEESKDEMLVTPNASDNNKDKKSKKNHFDQKRSPLSILPNDPVKNVFKLNSGRSSD